MIWVLSERCQTESDSHAWAEVIAMKNRTLAIGLTALAIAAVIFIAKRPLSQRENASQLPTKEEVSEDRVASPQSADSAGKGSTARPDAARVSPTAQPPAASPPPVSPGDANPLPYPVNQPVVVGAKTFVPKAPPPPPDTQAAAELDKVRSMLRDYRTLYHENPVGTNAEIMKAVMGGNPKQAQLGPPEGQSLSANGELVDRWGTPYFFHQLSSELMEIRSAGPDKTLWTSDDIVTK